MIIPILQRQQIISGIRDVASALEGMTLLRWLVTTNSLATKVVMYQWRLGNDYIDGAE